MVVRLGSRELVKVMDFGLAGFAEGSTGLTRSGARMGTPSYMAPEQHLGQPIDRRTDVYALGILLYQLLVGRLPFEARTDYETARAHIEVPLPRPSQSGLAISPELEAIILRAAAKKPEDRYPSCAAFLSDLRRVATVERSGLERASTAEQFTVPAPPPLARTIGFEPTVPPEAPTATPPEPTPIGRQRRFPWWSATFLLLLAAGGGTAWYFLRPATPTPPATSKRSPKRPPSVTLHAVATVVPPPSPACTTAAECGPEQGCLAGRCVPAWSCLCYDYVDNEDAPPVVYTACRQTVARCQALQRKAVSGSTHLPPNGLRVPCQPVLGEHPGDTVGGREAWTPSVVKGAWVHAEGCLLTAPSP